MLIDTHCHLHDPDFFAKDLAIKMKDRAKHANVQKIIVIGTSHQDSQIAQDFSDHAREGIFWSYGIHPNNTSQNDFKFLKKYDFWQQDNRPIAIGEVGLDYHYPNYDKTKQFRLLEEMIDLAKRQNLPLIFHVREAFTDFFGVVDNFKDLSGVVHSFTGNKKELNKVLERGFYVGVNGMATYSTLPLPPLDRILLETDAPFLTPAQFRGKINEPAYVREVAKWLGLKLGVDFAEIAVQTTNNAKRLFKFPDTNYRSSTS